MEGESLSVHCSFAERHCADLSRAPNRDCNLTSVLFRPKEPNYNSSSTTSTTLMQKQSVQGVKSGKGWRRGSRSCSVRREYLLKAVQLLHQY